jgi:hypothetical protein
MTEIVQPGDLGPNTGEMGTIMRLFDKVLRPLEDMLVRLGYVGLPWRSRSSIATTSGRGCGLACRRCKPTATPSGLAMRKSR